MAYILPMIAFDFGETRSVIVFFFFFIVLAYLCVRNNNIYANIYLEFKGYRIYMCDIVTDVLGKKQVYCDSLVISALNDLTQMVENEISYWDFENDIYIQLDEEKTE